MKVKKTFQQWMAEVVDRQLEILCGMGSECMEDYCYRSCYEDGLTPKTAAKEAIVHAKNG
jgi:hypothetical protein